MSLENLLIAKKAAIVDKWFDLVVRTYPSDTQQFLHSQKDPFANPVGQTTSRGLKALFDQVIEGIDRDKAGPFLDPIIRIRAVQNFSPSRAVAFILDLKPIVKSVLGKAAVGNLQIDDWWAFQRNVDALALFGFDIYAQCREQIYTMKANNERSRVLKTFARAGLITEDPENGTDTSASGSPDP